MSSPTSLENVRYEKKGAIAYVTVVSIIEYLMAAAT